jgi:hypothetical protein
MFAALIGLGTLSTTTPVHFSALYVSRMDELKVSSSVWPGQSSPENVHALGLKMRYHARYFNPPGTYSVSINVHQPNGFAYTEVGGTILQGWDPALGNPPAGTVSSEWIRYEIGPGSLPHDIPINYLHKQNGKLANGTLWFVFRETHFHDMVETTVVYNAKYSVNKQLLLDASIDSRKAFGQPNDQTWPVSPNQELRNLNFGAWTFRGGLFAGHMPLATGDFSGTGRIQLWVENPVADTFYSTLTLVHLGPPPGNAIPGVPFPGAAVDLHAFAPSGSSSTTEMTATWANRWSPSSSLDSVQFSSSAIDFANWQVTQSSSSSYNTPSAAREKLIVGVDEANFPVGEAAWRYFASREYEAIGWSTLDFPKWDSRPRLWGLLLTQGIVELW